MSMSELRRYNLAKVTAEARKKHPQIEIETDNGEVFTIDPPHFWNERATDPTVGPRDTAMEILGDQFDRFIESGGSVSGLNLIIAQYAEDEGLTLGKS